MKKMMMAAIAAFLCVNTYAQSEIAKATFNKDPQSAVVYNLSYPEEAVNNGVENRMNKFGKAKKVKGFLMYRAVNISDISGSPVTLYIGVEKKDKKDNNTQLTLLIANEFDRFYTAEENGELFSKAKDFVNGFSDPVAAADLELKIAAQQDIFSKQDKKVKKLKDDAADYEKQKKKLEDKIADNAKETGKEEEELSKQKEALDVLTKQRKN
ncbi:MAG: hypothetical protein QM687_06915 [Ferruginibacter sp.]